MKYTTPATLDEARERAWSIPLDQLVVADPELFQTDTFWPYFERLRREAPVHYCRDSSFGPYWSVTKFNDIMTVGSQHAVYSSDSRHGGITIRGQQAAFPMPMFIAMDPPDHGVRRRVISPIVGPLNLGSMVATLRERAQRVLDGLPRGEPFDWVDRVSIELATQTLATLFDFPFDERHKLTRWSDVAAAMGGANIEAEDERRAELRGCAAYFMNLWNERINAEPRNDLISMLCHAEATRNMGPDEFLGNLLLLIVGGDETTRNSLSGGAYAFSRYPEQYDKLRGDPALLDSAVSEIVRWQTPVAHMRRTAVVDTELGGQRIRKGDKVVMWYVSGNRDDEMFGRPDELIIDRPRARHHVSFGFGVHRCVGSRLAELQLRIVWEEILKRELRIEVLGPPEHIASTFMHGYSKLPVRVTS